SACAAARTRRTARVCWRARSPMLLLHPAVLLPLVLGPAQGAPRADRFTHELVARLRSVTSAMLAPDGRRAAYVLAVPREVGVEEDGPSWAELHVVDVESGKSRAYVAGPVNVSNVAWTRDGHDLAFLAKRAGDAETALYLIPADGGEARRAVALSGPI